MDLSALLGKTFEDWFPTGGGFCTALKTYVIKGEEALVFFNNDEYVYAAKALPSFRHEKKYLTLRMFQSDEMNDYREDETRLFQSLPSSVRQEIKRNYAILLSYRSNYLYYYDSLSDEIIRLIEL